MLFSVGQRVFIPDIEKYGTIVYYDKDTDTYDVNIGTHECDCLYCRHKFDIVTYVSLELMPG